MTDRAELVPLAHRVGALQGARLLLAATVAGVAWLGEPSVGRPSIALVPLAVLYLAITAGFEVLRRVTGRRGIEVISTSLLIDGGFLVAAVASTGGATSPLLFLVYVHIVATTLLASFRTGAGVAVWHALLLVSATHVASPFGAAAPSPGDDVALVVASYLVVAGATAAFASLNERALRRSRRAATTLLELGVALEESRTLVDVATVGASHLQRLAPLRRATVLVRLDEAWSGVVAADNGAVPVALRGGERPVVGDGHRYATLHATLDPAVWPELDAVLPGAANVVVVPLVADGRDVGLAAVECGARRATLPVDELQLIEQAGARIALSIQGVQLLDEVERMATSDPLTGLPNRRVFDEALTREVGRAHRYGTPLALALLDVDHFKQVNDVHGHPMGDEVLRQLADALRDATRPESLVARYGGEEFVVLLPDAARDDAMTAAERLRRSAQTVGVLPVTVSVGVAVLDAGDDPAALVAAADAALYRAKESGRNRTVCADRVVDQAGVRSSPVPHTSAGSASSIGTITP